MATFVLVPGTWQGGWWFEPLARQFVDTNYDGLYNCAACGTALFDSARRTTRSPRPTSFMILAWKGL